MRWAPLVLVAVVAVTAGCGSLAGGEGGTEPRSLTPAPVPATDSTPGPETVAPGLAADRVVDHAALVANHAAVINSSSHTYRRRVTRRYANGTVWREYTTVVERNGSALRYRYNWSSAVGDGRVRSTDRWRSDGLTYVARTVGNETNFSVEATTADGPVGLGTENGYAASLPRFLRLLDVTVTGPEVRDGERQYRLVTPEPVRLSPSRNVTFTGYVTSEGVFTGYRLSYLVARGDVRTAVTVRASFEDVGTTTVSRPSWLRQALAPSSDE